MRMYHTVADKLHLKLWAVALILFLFTQLKCTQCRATPYEVVSGNESRIRWKFVRRDDEVSSRISQGFAWETTDVLSCLKHCSSTRAEGRFPNRCLTTIFFPVGVQSLDKRKCGFDGFQNKFFNVWTKLRHYPYLLFYTKRMTPFVIILKSFCFLFLP